MAVNVHRKKLRLGLIYGIVAGFAFGLFAWGADALMLARANDSYYWVKFVPGLVLCVLSGGLMGWLTILIHRHVFAILMWSLLAVLYSWLVVWLPLSGSARMITMMNSSLAELFKFSQVLDIGQFRLISLVVIGLAAIISGILEINLIDQALLSPYISATVVAMLVGVILFGIAGSATDHMINSTLREPVQVVNTLLQFAQENTGVEVPKETARKMHLSAVNQLGVLIQKPRHLTLISYDENLLMVDILVDLGGTMAKCSTIFAQPTDCTILPLNP